MGFAGQVFAARVAVGLAMPSPKAFSQAGALIGGFASNMYARLNKDSVNASKRNLNTTTASLKKSREMLAQHGANQGQFLDKSATKAIQRLRGAYKGLGKSAMSSASAMKAFKGSMAKGSIKTKMFANVSKDMNKAKDYAQMMKNFTKLKKEQRNEIIAGFQADAKALAATINTSAKREKLGKDGVQLIKDEIAITKDKIKEFQHYDKARTNADSTYNKQQKKLNNNVLKGEKLQQKSKRELLAVQQRQLEMQKKITAASQKFVFEMKSNFTESLRESVSLLTAFYYKLSQNTQELISFERELLNANSVFRVTNDELFSVGDTVVQFGQEFGLSMQNGATGLYQLASAGLTASESMEVLTETLKLSMAVQGDHNTISKLVTQTLFGYDMEMSKAAEVTDKFAFAIQKSLIEYQDLSSAVKFALPFFTSTGQSIDQLLGALQILTNRALEAGIAGRGLRQGVAELAESIGDASANFKQMGVEVVDNQGNMLQLTEIAANFSRVLDDGVINDTELLTTLIQDLNVRGATAFVHLVQSSEEFTEAVEATANAGGELDEMIKIQNQSIMAQIQILQNNVTMMFLYNDAAYEGTRFLNAFHEAVVTTVESLQDLIVTEKNGIYTLTEFGFAMQEMAINAIKEFKGILDNVIPIIKGFVSVLTLGFKLFQVYLIPVKLIIKALETMGPALTKVVIGLHLLTRILPITKVLTLAAGVANIMYAKTTYEKIKANIADKAATDTYIASGLAYLILAKITNIETYKTIALKLRAMLIDKWYTGFWWPTQIGYRIGDNRNLIIGNALALKEFLIKQKNAAIDFISIKYKALMIYLRGTTIKQKIMLIAVELKYFIQSRAAYTLDLAKNSLALVSLALGAKTLALSRTNNYMIGKETILKIGQQITNMKGFLIDLKVAMGKKLVLFWQKATTLQTYKDIAAKLMDIIVTMAYSTVTFIAAAATTALSVALLFNPIGLIVIGFVAAVVAIAIFAVKINEQIGLWDMMMLSIKHLFGMIKWGAGIWLDLFKRVGVAVYNILEGPLFKLGLFFSHLFKMLAYYAMYIGGLLMDKLVTPIVNGFKFLGSVIADFVIKPILNIFGRIKELIEGMKNPLFTLKDIIFDYLVNPIMRVIDGIKDAVALAAGLNPLANGGYVQPMANGGSAGRKPYLVGERGPEIFMPTSSGKIVPNKDLNTKRVHNMLQTAFESDSDVDKAAGLIQANSMQVAELIVKEAKLGKSRIGIDSFAGGI